MERGLTRSVGETLRPFVDARGVTAAAVNAGTRRNGLTKKDVLRLYTDCAPHMGHRASDREFHKTLIGLSKAADYTSGREIVIGHSNSFLGRRCTMAKTTFTDQLRKHDGKTIRRQISGNGHRFVARKPSASHDGEVIYHNGISLEPMIDRILALLPVLGEEAEARLAVRVAKARASAARRRQREAMHSTPDDRLGEACDIELASRATALPFRSACQRGDVEQAERLADAMVEAATTIEALNAPPETPEVGSPTSELSEFRHQLPLQIPKVLDTVMLSEEELAETTVPEVTNTSNCDDDWKPGELKVLFPTLAMYLSKSTPTDWGSVVDAGERLVAALGINQGCWAEAGRVMGRKNRYVALGLVAELTSQSRILTTPGRYFGGMLRKARSGELDLRRSVWKLRTKSATSSVIDNSRWRRTC